MEVELKVFELMVFEAVVLESAMAGFELGSEERTLSKVKMVDFLSTLAEWKVMWASTR